MTDKDSNYMTASEMLRWSANYTMYYRWGNPWNKLAIAILGLDPEKARAQEVHITDAFSRLADKIDAELAQARDLSLRQGAELWAKANGWPDFREGEDFGAWLDRCAIPRPFDESGDPWLIGDRVIAGYHGETTVTGYSFNGLEMFLRLRKHGIDNAAAYSAQYCQRPAPEVLGADGLPIKVGDAMWSLSGAGPLTVTSLHTDDPTPDGGDSPWADLDDDGLYSWIYAGSLTHTPPDTQERIDEDKKKLMYEYWECKSSKCGECPATIDGKKPSLYYGVRSCSTAQGMDIASRQHELDKRTGGAE